MIALFTKHIKKQFIKRKFKPNFQKKDLKEYVFYQCNKKGHLAKNCPNGSGEEKKENKVSQENTFSRNKFQKKKALVAAWGSDSEEEPKVLEFSQERYLKANGSSAGSATSEVKVKKENMWYFDSRCSCHMTGNKRTMSSLQHL